MFNLGCWFLFWEKSAQLIVMLAQKLKQAFREVVEPEGIEQKKPLTQKEMDRNNHHQCECEKANSISIHRNTDTLYMRTHYTGQHHQNCL